jgi:hypothetical protein
MLNITLTHIVALLSTKGDDNIKIKVDSNFNSWRKQVVLSVTYYLRGIRGNDFLLLRLNARNFEKSRIFRNFGKGF